MLKARMCPGSPHAMFKKALIGLQRYKQTKVNPHWWVNSKIERAVARYIKTKTKNMKKKRYNWTSTL